jgi:hypothetical protein
MAPGARLGGADDPSAARRADAEAARAPGARLGGADDPSAAWRADAEAARARVDWALFARASGAVFLELGAPVPSAVRDAWGWEGPTEVALDTRVHPAHREALRAALDAHRARPEAPLELDAAFALRGRGWRYLRVRAASRVGPDGRAARTLVGLVDVTEARRLAERAEAAEHRADTLAEEVRAARAAAAPRSPAPPRAALSETRRALEALEARLPKIRSALGRARGEAERWPRIAWTKMTASLEAAQTEATDLRGAAQELRAHPPEGLARLLSLSEELALVALNAQLEALRLGDAGSGLAAVAAKMKALTRDARAAGETLSSALETAHRRVERVEASAQRLERHLERAAQNVGGEAEAVGELDLRSLRAALDEAARLSTPDRGG